MLNTIRRGIPIDFGHLTPDFALALTQHTPKRGPHPAPGFAASKSWHDAAFDFGEPDGPGTHRLQCQVCWWYAQLRHQLHGSLLHNMFGTMIAYDLQL